MIIFICIILLYSIISNSFSVCATKNELSECFVLVEANSKVIISSNNENKVVPIGVMSKLMTIYLVAEEIEQNRLMLTDTLKTSTYANSAKGATIWLMPGEEITVDELLKAVIIGNANDAAVVLAEKISGTENEFTEKMNKTAKQLGMINTTFTNCNGFYDDNKQLSTAYDLAILCSALIKYNFLYDYFTCWRDFVRNEQTELVNTNELVKSYKGIVGFKTGYTEHAGYCTAVAAVRDNATYVAIVLGNEDKSDNLSLAKSLLDTAFSQYKIVTPELPDKIPTEIIVKGGLNKSVPVEYEKIRNVVLPNSAINSVSSKIIITDYVYAPVKKGYKVGEIQFFRNDKLMFCVDIVTKENIDEINIPKALNIILKKLLTF
ncbi:MAG: D-alanyl-D-alanine carboxypeptidase [Oscillospiraceae bacterium]|nr:D-alanyl-D-alanine carboxypeptidase [Oscillospiraceae bacterium]